MCFSNYYRSPSRTAYIKLHVLSFVSRCSSLSHMHLRSVYLCFVNLMWNFYYFRAILSEDFIDDHLWRSYRRVFIIFYVYLWILSHNGFIEASFSYIHAFYIHYNGFLCPGKRGWTLLCQQMCSLCRKNSLQTSNIVGILNVEKL